MMSVKVRCSDCQNEFGGFADFSKEAKFPPTLEDIFFYLEYELSGMAMHICPRSKNGA